MNVQVKSHAKSEIEEYLAEKQRKKSKALDNWLKLSYQIKKKSTIEEILECRDEGRR